MIDLCIVNYNTKTLLKRLLDSLHADAESYPGSWTISVSDNGSQDGSWDWLDMSVRKNGLYKVSRAWKNENIGYSAACNNMASSSECEIVALLNADVWLSSRDVSLIQEVFDKNSDIHILGPKQRNEYHQITHAGIIGTNKKPAHRGWMELDVDDSKYRDRIECVTVSGSAYFVRKAVWDSLSNNSKYRELYPNAKGAFLPTPHYYEETWCSYFARHLGYNVIYDGSISIGHSWHASSPKPGEGYSHADSYFKLSQKIFREACDYFKIERD